MNKEMQLSKLLENIGQHELLGLPSQIISSLAYDSRKVRQGSCFVAIKGENSDGHDFIEQAIYNGASAVICERLPQDEIIDPKVSFIITDNSRRTLARISHTFYDYPAKKMKIIGITGTNGKTTCTFLIKSIIESAGKKCGIIGTTGIFTGNRQIPATHTTPESLELAEILSIMVKDGADFAVMEVSSHSLMQYRVEGIDFAAGMFTNLTHDHLDYHKTIKNYAEAKKILFKNLTESAYAIINTDSEWAEFMTNDIKCKNIVTVGRKKSNTFRIMREVLNLNGIELILYSDNCLINIITSLAGEFNIDNAAICAAACKSLGISTQAIQHGLSVTKGAPGRMQRINLPVGAVALVDYAHTPDALEKALKSCRDALISSDSEKGKLICVFGCGGDRDKTKRPEMGRISSDIADYTIITSDNPRTEEPLDIIEDIIRGILSGTDYEIIPDREEAIKKAVSLTQKGDILLVAGKGHENYQIIGKEKFHFDDVEEIGKFA